MLRGLLLCAGLMAAIGSVGTGWPAGAESPPGPWCTLAGEKRDAAAMEAFARRLMDQYGVTALSVAVLDGGQTVYERTLGVVDPKTGKPADERTVFRAASLTKPVFAYLVLKLVDEGVLDLDTPLVRYLPKPLYAYPAYASLKDDPRHERLTARLLLSHQSGLPNWRRIRPNGPIQFNADPGDQFGYSGEGYALLQFVIETVTGQDLPTLAREKVFVPLKMNDTSFLWEPRFDGHFGVELDSPLGQFIEKTRHTGNAAASVITHASDYARFLAAVLNGDGLKPQTRAAMLEPQVALTSKSLFSAPGTDPGTNRAHKMAWALGWGTFQDTHGRALFHVGAEEGCENFVEAFPDRGLGIAVLSLTTSNDSFMAPLVDYAIGAAFSPLEWLEYGQPDFLDWLGHWWLWILAGVVMVGLAILLWGLRSTVRRAWR
jgi:CubicO group peptidase (beta-lactamase class C family)